MGLGDVVSRVLLKFEANTREASRDVRKFKTTAQKDAADMAASWGKVAAAVAGIATAAVVARKGIQDFTEFTRLSANTAGLNIDKLKTSADGLVSEMDLLRVATEANTGTLRLSQEETEKVVAGMASFIKQGREQRDVIQRVGQAIREQNVEPLKDLGIVLKTTGSTAGDMSLILEALDENVRSVGDGSGSAAESAARMGTAFTDAMDDMSIAVGQLAIQLTPVIEGMTKMFRGLRQLWMTKAQIDLELQRAHMEEVRGDIHRFANEGLAKLDTGDRDARRALAKFGTMGLLPHESIEVLSLADVARAKEMNRPPRSRGGRGGGVLENDSEVTLARRRFEAAQEAHEARRRDADLTARAIEDERFRIERERLDILRDTLADEQERERRQEAGQRFDVGKGLRGLDESIAALDGMESGGSQMATSIFGGPSKFAQMESSLQQLAAVGQQSFGILQSAAAAAFDAMITGSTSLGAALKGAIAEGLRATAVQMGVEAIKNVALGTAALAIGGPVGGFSAGAYFKAAGIAAATAVAAGAGARALGAGGGASAPGQAGAAGAGPSFAGGGRPSGDQGTTANTFILGSEHDSDSPRQREARLARAMKRARRLTTGAGVVEFS